MFPTAVRQNIGGHHSPLTIKTLLLSSQCQAWNPLHPLAQSSHPPLAALQPHLVFRLQLHRLPKHLSQASAPLSSTPVSLGPSFSGSHVSRHATGPYSSPSSALLLISTTMIDGKVDRSKRTCWLGSSIELWNRWSEVWTCLGKSWSSGQSGQRMMMTIVRCGTSGNTSR